MQLGPIEIGQGQVKVIVPLVGRTRDEIIEAAKDAAVAPCQAVEWRVDYFEEAYATGTVLGLLDELRAMLEQKALIFTWRTKQEGGQQIISGEDYYTLLEKVVRSGQVDAVDVEFAYYPDKRAALIEASKASGVRLLMSQHDFSRTPNADRIASQLLAMQEAGAHIAKFACMPHNAGDVLALLSATYRVKKQYPKRPLITMAMGELGIISRLGGYVFGSDMTFASLGSASAPGQVNAYQMRDALLMLNRDNRND